MSAEAEVSGALSKPVEQSTESTEQVKEMLKEVEGDAAEKEEVETTDKPATDEPNEAKTNGTSGHKDEPEADKENDNADRRDNRSSDRRRGDRFGGRGRGRGRGGRGGFAGRGGRNNIKSDLTTQEESDDPVEIRKQVEFYFSDSNLPRDSFLLEKVGGSKNNPVELKILHTFKRMRHFQPFTAIVEAMRESTFLELCEDDTCVRRIDPLPASLDNGPDPNSIQVFEDRAMPRSVYVKGFGEEKPSTQFDIEKFFAEYGATNAVRLRRSEDKLFKGSVFVEFDSEETATKFLETDPKPTYDGKELQIMSKKEYCDKKVEDIKAGKIRPNSSRNNNSRREGRGGRDRDFKRKRDDEDDRDWRVRREEDRKGGFRDRRSRGDPDYSKGGKPRYNKVEKDESGIPVVKETRDSGRADALAKAKAAVEKDNEAQQTTADEAPKIEGEGADFKKEAGASSESVAKDAEATTGTKRAREDDAADEERDVKRVDTKEGEVGVES